MAQMTEDIMKSIKAENKVNYTKAINKYLAKLNMLTLHEKI